MKKRVCYVSFCFFFLSFLTVKAKSVMVVCAAPTQLTLLNQSSNSVTFSWSDSNTVVTQWEVFFINSNTGIPPANSTGTLVSTPQYTLNNLTPGTLYRFFVRSHCPNGELSPWSTGLTILNPANPPSCGSTFTDAGGLNNNYPPNEDRIWTICPAVPGEFASVVFSSFDVMPQEDALYVYNGPDINSPQIASTNGAGNVPGGLAGGYWGTTLPGPFLASNGSGCLTFRFRSDGSFGNSGWNAQVDCIPDPNCYELNTAITATQITDTSVTVTWTPPSGITQWEVLYVPCASAPPSAGTNGILVNTNSYTFTNLNPNTCYTPYVRSLCPFPPGGYSLWAIGTTFTSHYPDLSCGAIFTDYPGNFGSGYSNNTNEITTICPDTSSESVTVTFTSFNTEVNFDALFVFNGNSTQAPMLSSNNGPGFYNYVPAGGYWGSTIPGPFTSTSPDGCLTFQFITDDSVTFNGWEAQVTCNPIQPKLVAIAFLDRNANGIHDIDEPYFNRGQFIIQQNNSGIQTLVSTSSGFYRLVDSNANNTYDISYQINADAAAYFTGNGFTVNDTTINTTTQFVYFPVTALQPFSDVEVTIYPYKSPVPGFQHRHRIVLKNNSTLATTGILTYTKPSPVTSFTVSPQGATTTASGFTYPYALAPFQNIVIEVVLNLPTSPALTINAILTASASTVATNDNNLSNNDFSLTEQVVGAWDPNVKTEQHGPQIPLNTFNDTDDLYYTLRFQNEGTSNAINIRVEDTLESGIIPESVQMVNATHPYVLERTGNQLVWKLDQIHLPPKTVSEPLSQGSLQFKAKLYPGFQAGTQILNTAEIYFDTNPAVFTNTWVTEFVAPLTIESFEASAFLLYPNPAQTIVYLKPLQDQPIQKVRVYDFSGKKIKEIDSLDPSTPSIEIQELQTGIYVVEINTRDGLIFYEKLVKN